MVSEVTRFFREVMENEKLKEKYLKLGETTKKEELNKKEKLEKVVDFASDNGFSFTVDELQVGIDESVISIQDGPYTCACVMGGGGPGEDPDPKKYHCCATCACVLGGIGMWYGDSARCVCPLAGGGVE